LQKRSRLGQKLVDEAVGTDARNTLEDEGGCHRALQDIARSRATVIEDAS